MTTARLATAAAAAAVLGLGVAGCGSRIGPAAGQPSPQSAGTPGSPAPGQAGRIAPPHITVSPAPPGVPGWARIRLTGSLPASGPASGAVRSLPGGAAAPARVRALAAALRLTGSPQRVNGGWRVSSPRPGGGTLQVAGGHGQHWTYRPAPVVPRCDGPIVVGVPQAAAPGSAGSTGNTRPGTLRRVCPMGPGRVTPQRPPPVPPGGTGAPPNATAAPSRPAAESVAKPVLRAAGAGRAPRRITTLGSSTFVSADPVVDGLATSGFSTTVGVGTGGRITTASGWLSRPTPGARYPLISASEAFSRLRSSPRAAPGSRSRQAMCPVNPDVLCGTPGPLRVVRVTGASYGLALGYSAGEPLLVPSWLFGVAGSGLRIPEVAISSRYLGG